MQKLLSLLFIAMFVLDCKAEPYELTGYFSNWHKDLTYKPNDTIKKVWGNPSLNETFIQDASKNYGEFRIKEGWAWPRENPQEGKNDQAVMALLAHNITEHGAEFCLTQISAANSWSFFSIYYQHPNWPGLQCAWFCEPGWDGVACKEKTSENHSCNNTDYVTEINNVKKDIYGGNDAIAVHWSRPGAAESVTCLAAIPTPYNHQGTRYQHEIVIGATKFMKHGIVASPILLASVGTDAPSIITSSLNANGTTKTLCAQGYTKDNSCNVSSKHCGSDIFCSVDEEKKFNKAQHTTQIKGFCKAIICKDADKALDANYNCQDCKYTIQSGRCAVVEKENYGKCIKCEVGQYFDQTDCSCKAAKRFGSDALRYGNQKTEAASLQCWSLENLDKYKECVLNTTDANNTSTAVSKWY